MEGTLTAATRPADPRARRRAIWIRLVVAPISLAVVVGVLFLHDRTGNPLPTDVLLAVLGAGAAFELARVLRTGGVEADLAVATVASGLTAGVGLFAPFDPAARMAARAILPVAALTALLFLRLLDLRRASLAGLSATILPIVYVGLPLGFAREIDGTQDLARWLVYVVVVAKASDIGGWVVGKPLGRHKLIPAVSPGKSWEGLAGGLALSLLAAVLLPEPLAIGATGWSVAKRAAFGLLLGVASVAAGLTHSAFKRRAGVKDSAPLIPEMGGLLDMVDSMLLAAPVAWLWFAVGLG